MEAKKETPPPLPPIVDQLKEYAETRFKLLKYEAIEGGTSILASVITDAITAISMVLAFIFASFTLAYYLSDVLDSFWEGFGCVALIYLIIAVVIKLNKERIEKPLVNLFIQKLFKK
ncbi:phage holin family protein [Mucilaginibacter sabulilitoris]|uniref:Phage holin family protein n=1 Tax=Mucilaginibacter sabulilitoris TaxID=1173583 RepID=A0ABZ0TLX6_9SPHI|nr:phage holin family protein [Mucilaginibacter sabulilitoris]WPU94166.1 phage holin family protein [Mucilaginibacter sabulilitoris]